MKEIIFKFLDFYLGDSLSVSKKPNLPKEYCGSFTYKIISKKNKRLIIIIVYSTYGPSCRIITCSFLRTNICNYFSTTNEFADKSIRDWLVEKHNIEKLIFG